MAYTPPISHAHTMGIGLRYLSEDRVPVSNINAHRDSGYEYFGQSFTSIQLLRKLPI